MELVIIDNLYITLSLYKLVTGYFYHIKRCHYEIPNIGYLDAKKNSTKHSLLPPHLSLESKDRLLYSIVHVDNPYPILTHVIMLYRSHITTHTPSLHLPPPFLCGIIPKLEGSRESVCVIYVYSTLIIFQTIPVVALICLPIPFAVPAIRQL